MSVLVLGRVTRPLPWRTIGVVALLVLTVVVGAIIAGSQRRLPPPFGPAANGKLVLAEDGDIFLIDRATGAKTLAIGGPDWDVEPEFSLDGTRMAFFRVADSVRSLWLADDRGGAARKLSTTGLDDVQQIEWSPDGTSILLSTAADLAGAPAIVPTDGSAAHLIEVDMRTENPIWFPGGQEVLVRGTTSDGFGLFAIRPDGTGLRWVVPATGTNEWDALFFSFSPDGSKIAYQWREGDATQKIYVAPAAGGTPRAITSVESVGVLWSPDGTWIAFSSGDGAYVVRADGTTPERRVIPTSVAGGASIRWAPDSSRLLAVVSGQTDHLLFDPLGGPGETAPWTSAEFPDWQRLAPTP